MDRLRTVILIDDDELINLVHKEILHTTGMTGTIHTFTNAIQGLRIFRDNCSVQYCPELVLVDLKMPILDGFAFLEELKLFFQYKERVKIVMLSSSIEEDDKAKALQLGFDDYLVKPLTKEKLQAIIKKIFG